jgi:hypothetical protein
MDDPEPLEPEIPIEPEREIYNQSVISFNSHQTCSI